MIAARSRKNIRRYKKHQKSDSFKSSDCTFCAISKDDDHTIQITKHFKVFRNLFPYNLWDNQVVIDHLLVAPIQHTDTLADLNSAAALDYVGLISFYEQEGYNVYARAPVSGMKSVVHQHTHLIKISGKQIKGLVMLRKPALKWILR